MGLMYTIRARKLQPRALSSPSSHEWEIRFSGLASGLSGLSSDDPDDLTSYFDLIAAEVTTRKQSAEEKGLEGFLRKFPNFSVTKEDGMLWTHRHNAVDCISARRGLDYGPADPVCSSKVIGLVQSIVNYLGEGKSVHCQMTDSSTKCSDGLLRYYYWWTITVN